MGYLLDGVWLNTGLGGAGQCCRQTRAVLHACPTLGEDGTSFKPSLSYFLVLGLVSFGLNFLPNALSSSGTDRVRVKEPSE